MGHAKKMDLNYLSFCAYLGVDTLQGHLLVDGLLWAGNSVTMSLTVLVMIGVILGLGHGELLSQISKI